MSNAVTGETKEHTEQQRVLLLQLKGPPFNLQEVVSTEIRKTFNHYVGHTCAGMWVILDYTRYSQTLSVLAQFLFVLKKIPQKRLLFRSASGWTEQT